MFACLVGFTPVAAVGGSDWFVGCGFLACVCIVGVASGFVVLILIVLCASSYYAWFVSLLML